MSLNTAKDTPQNKKSQPSKFKKYFSPITHFSSECALKKVGELGILAAER